MLATPATQVGLKTELGRDLALAPAVTAAIVPVIRQAWLGKDDIEAWTRGDSVSSEVKGNGNVSAAGRSNHRAG